MPIAAIGAAVFEFALFLIFPAAMAFAGSMDLFTMTIPNRISLVLIAAFVLILPFAPFSWAAVASHVGAFLLMLAIGIAMFSYGLFGGGDAKLMACAALWLGFESLADYLMIATVCGGLLSVAILVFRGATLPAWCYGQAWAMRLHEKTGGIPYGVALAAAGLWIYPTTLWFKTFAV